MQRYDPKGAPETTELRLRIGTATGDMQIGQCIYCGSIEELTDEHPIPKGIWGQHILKSGSCKDCSTATSKVELKVLRNGLGRVREFLGAPTRHSRKRGRWTGRVEIQNEVGQRLNVPMHILPQFVLLPVFDYLPRKLLGEGKKEKHRKFGIRVCTLTDRQDPVASSFWGPSVNIDSVTWARFLAKVAYGEYIRVYDRQFRSDGLSKFIVRGTGDATNYVGGRESKSAIDFIYNVTFCALDRPQGGCALVSYLRLFSFLETPSYLVYLGELPSNGSVPVKLPRKVGWSDSDLWPTYPKDQLIEGGPITGRLRQTE
jgi:hypothetical protein